MDTAQAAMKNIASSITKSPLPPIFKAQFIAVRSNAIAIATATAAKRLYNQRPAWLDGAHKALDLAVAQA